MTHPWSKWGGLGVLTFGLLAAWRLHWVPMTLLELLGVLTGLVCCVLMIEARIANFPVGILNNLVYAVIFYQARLYGNMGLQFVYLTVAAIGWAHWARRAPDAPLRITHLTRTELLVLPLLALPATWALTVVLRQTGAAAPILDAVTTVLSLSAQYLLNLKRLENWFVGMTLVTLTGILCATQGLWLTAGLQGCYFLLCLLGLRAWRAMLRTDAGVSAPQAPPSPVVS
jgi:nicotinamide mononucleotide transporter